MILQEPRLFRALDRTWPAATMLQVGPWCIRDGAGGGKRVSAATALGPVEAADLPRAETAMRNLGQVPLFMIRPSEVALDRALQEQGYSIVDPVIAYASEIAALTTEPLPRVTAFAIWEPLAIMQDIWAAAGIGEARLAVMHRVTGPKTALLARHRDKPAGVAFAALDGDLAVVHAVEILPHQRRQGMGGWLMRAAAFWAAEQGATRMAVFCTAANSAANALYSSLGMTPVGQYHYRLLEEEPEAR